MATIVTRELTKRYGETVAVDGLDLELRRGEVFGLLGPNGAGKTTTILMMLGLTEPTSGTVEVLGFDPARNALDVKRHVGYMPDAVGFYETLTGRENLRYTARLNRMPSPEGQIDGLLGTVGLGAAADDPVGTYSRGMRQRLGLADALLKSPDILILDEPTTAIDPEGVSEMLTLIRSSADAGMTVLLSSHLLHQVQEVCDRVAIFVRGRVAAEGSPSELAESNPGPEVVEVGLDSDADLFDHLDGVPFVEDIASGRAPRTWRVTVAPGTTSDLMAVLVASRARVISLTRLDHDLDAVYRRHFRREGAHV